MSRCLRDIDCFSNNAEKNSSNVSAANLFKSELTYGVYQTLLSKFMNVKKEVYLKFKGWVAQEEISPSSI